MTSCSIDNSSRTTYSLFKLRINSPLAIWHSFLHFSSEINSFSSNAFISNIKSFVPFIIAFSLVAYAYFWREPTSVCSPSFTKRKKKKKRDIYKLYNSLDMSSIANLHSSLERSEILVDNTCELAELPSCSPTLAIKARLMNSSSSESSPAVAQSFSYDTKAFSLDLRGSKYFFQYSIPSASIFSLLRFLLLCIH